MTPKERERLSRTVAHALRHAPEEYGVELDPAGWVEVRALLEALRERRSSWEDLAREDLAEMIRAADRDRYELEGRRIRARYGHSVPVSPERAPERPPETLYHGTTPEAASRIRRQGLRPMGRQHVHLSRDRETARTVGLRRTDRPRLLAVRALRATRDGVAFYRAGDDVWLSGPIPPEHLNDA